MQPAAQRHLQQLTHEREILEPVDLALPDGRLNRQAVGWSRRPLQRCALPGGWPARKRWNFWGVQTDTHLLRMTYACTDYLGILDVGLLDYASGQNAHSSQYGFFQRQLRFPAQVVAGPLRFARQGFELCIDEEPPGTRLKASFSDRAHRFEVDVLVEQPPAHESLSVVIPWNEHRFQFTSKHNTRPARGSAVLDGKTYGFDSDNHAYGVLDYGRGVWPYNTTWNWASASGRQGEHVVGLNLGGQWTDGTGMTENGLCIDGRLHKIGDDLVWEYDRKDFSRPWRIRAPHSQRVDLTFTPRLNEAQRVELLIARSELHWALGTFSGTIVDDLGEELGIDGLLGWAEEHRARW
ncbi:MAG: DUF2804 domain-containing protein [Deltaproteobacteria bacterium]|nr:DUF2804 domain-containing protein [Deltaproteobacteria bacterium]